MKTESKPLRIEVSIPIKRDRPKGQRATNTPQTDDESVPRIARLLALAHKWERMVRRGESDYAEVARQHGLSRARVSQICSLTVLAPELQTAILLREEKMTVNIGFNLTLHDSLWVTQPNGLRIPRSA